MVIGYWTGLDKIHGISEPVKRAMDEAAEALRKQGHKIVEFEIDWIVEAV